MQHRRVDWNHSPSTEDIVRWFAHGVPLQKGTIFDKLNDGSKKWHIYRGDEFPQSFSLKGIHYPDNVVERMLRRAAQVSVIDHVTIVGFDKRVREVVWLAGAGDFCLEFSQGRSLIPHNLIDHRIYDHSSVPATLEAIFGLTAITNRDAQANNVSKLVTLSSPRSTPETLLSPASEGARCPFPNPSAPVMAALAPHATGLVARPLESPNEGNLPGFLNIAQRVDLELSPPQLHAAVTAKHRLSLSTRTNAAAYLEEVRMKARAAEAK
jgi:hypothetical protein